MARSKGRTGRPWRRAWDTLRRSPGSEVCALCGGWIDKALPAGHPDSWTADHIDPLSQGGAEIALSNLRPAHMRCNSARGNGKGKRAVPLPTSEVW